MRFKRKLRELYWWPGLDKESERFVKQCLPCNDSAKSTPKLQMPHMSLRVSETAWEEVSMDITGPFSNAPSHMKHMVVIIDNYSRFPEILCTTDITTRKIKSWLSQIFARYGNPSKIITDNGPQFKSEELKNFLQDRDIFQEFTPVYTPQQNAFVESFNRYLKHGVQTFENSHLSWEENLNQLLAQFRSTSQEADEKSPAEKFLGRQHRLPFQIVRFRTRRGESGESANGHGKTLYQVGDKVRVRRPHTPKGRRPWSEPLTVI